MKITYKNSYWQILSNSISANWRNRVILAINLFNLLLVFWVSYSNSIDEKSGDFQLISFVFNILVFLFLIWVIMVTISLLMTAQIVLSRGSAGALGPHHIELLAEGLIEETSVNRTVVKWSGVHRIVANATFIRIYSSPTNLYLIPRSAFSSKQQCEDFLEMARQFYKLKI